MNTSEMLPWRAYLESARAIMMLAAARPPGDCVRDAMLEIALQTLDQASMAFLVQHDPQWWSDVRELNECVGPVFELTRQLEREVEQWRREQSRRRPPLTDERTQALELED